MYVTFDDVVNTYNTELGDKRFTGEVPKCCRTSCSATDSHPLTIRLDLQVVYPIDHSLARYVIGGVEENQGAHAEVRLRMGGQRPCAVDRASPQLKRVVIGTLTTMRRFWSLPA